MKNDLQKNIEQFVDFLLPTLTPYEAGLYIFFLRNSYIKNNASEIRIGKRTIADNLGASRGEKTNYAHVTKLVDGLEEKGGRAKYKKLKEKRKTFDCRRSRRRRLFYKSRKTERKSKDKLPNL